MSKWIFLEDFDLSPVLDQAVNLAFAAHFSLRIEDAQIVIFFAGGHIDPHVLAFKSKELCQTAYDDLKLMLRAEK